MSPLPNSLRNDLSNLSVLVTGGSGTFGSSFAARLLQSASPQRVIIFSRGEMRQFEMQQQAPFKISPSVRFFIGDVRDQDRLEMAMRNVDVVVHAAALKQVPAAEYNPFECIRTNVHGAENVVRAAIRCGVQRVIALSTDKAVNPVNLYGASKLASDKIFVAANTLAGRDGPKFSVVRYGNVMGSRGSVIPFFRDLIANGATSLPITDERMTRFLMPVSQSVDFVLSCLRMMRGGEIFIPKIPSARIVDIAKWLAPSLPHHVVGIRPGEKLHEILITADQARNCFEAGDRYVLMPEFPSWTDKLEIPAGAHPVADDFAYASDRNPEWLDRARFEALLAAE